MKTFCICLPEYQVQIEKARTHFTASGLTDVDFFCGINAPVAGLDTSHLYEYDHPGSGFRMGAKGTGCWLSHYMLWNCLLRLPDEHFLVLEADAQFHDGFRDKFAQALRDTPANFDFLHLGHCCLKGHKTKPIVGLVHETNKMLCTHAYVIRRGCIPFLLKTLRKVWAPIDIQLQLECFPHLRTYAVMPRIVSQFDTELPP